MKQFLDSEKAKDLIPLIGEPKSIESVERKVKWTSMFGYKPKYNYSFGELLGYCPLCITIEGKEYDRTIIGHKLRYRTKSNNHVTYGKRVELIDNLYDFIKSYYSKK